ncbi:JDVT-CTERM system glutamic-type intramembrane protease [Roseateles saccharophilus]|uniref:CAAX prenyl protease-like protein n=1 Tax=Roseateles saccharophilus TaxID=304 RepID=A0A4R3URY1_ROSSA|nr:CAAX prenyl protease-like protein [Roseateles saccharophilus]
MIALAFRPQRRVLPWLLLSCAGLAVGPVLAFAGMGTWRLFVVVGLAPLLEEIVFRAGVQAELTPLMRSGHAANLVTSTLFGLAHGLVAGPAHGMAVLLPSLLLGECWRRRPRLGPCVALHGAMNAAWLLGLDAMWAGGLAPLTPSFATG